MIDEQGGGGIKKGLLDSGGRRWLMREFGSREDQQMNFGKLIKATAVGLLGH